MKLILSGMVAGLFLTGQMQGPFAASYPAAKLPSNIKPLTGYGEHGEFTLDGSSVMFIGTPGGGGDVKLVNIVTKSITTLVAKMGNTGWYRAYPMSNGDIFLSGGPSRGSCNAYIKSGSRLTNLGVHVIEGAAVSRTQLRIAYRSSSQIRVADIVYANGVPHLANDHTVNAFGEPQNFRPGNINYLTWTDYGLGGSEGLMLNLANGSSLNFTKNGCYQEAEGIFPDGQYSAVEDNRHICSGGNRTVDIYKYKLDGSGSYQRLTHFADTYPYKSSNPVVSPNGRYMVFQESRQDVAAGLGYGLYLYDFSGGGGTNRAPTCAFASPQNGQAFPAPATITVKVNASDPDGSIADVKMYKNTVFVRQEGTDPYIWNGGNMSDAAFQKLPSGTYTLKAIATDDKGAMTASSITIRVGALAKAQAGPSAMEASVDQGITLGNPASDDARENTVVGGLKIFNATRESLGFNLPMAGAYTLSFFTLSGTEIAGVKTGQGQAGTNQVSLQGLNLAPGTYISDLRFGDQSASRRIVLLKR